MLLSLPADVGEVPPEAELVQMDELALDQIFERAVGMGGPFGGAGD